MSTQDDKIHKESDGTLTSESLAVLIIDGLLDAGLIKEDNFEDAVKIAALEINIRKHAGDY